MPRVFHPTLNTTMCHVRTQNGTNLMENTMAFNWTGTAPTGTELTNLATAIGTGAFITAMRAFTSNSWIFRQVYCRNIDTEVANEGEYDFPPGTTGNRSGSQLAASEACGLVKRTGHTGRGQHGRMSVSGFVEGDVDGNSLGNSLMAMLATAAFDLLIDYLSNRFIAALAHIPRSGTTPGHSDLITETAVLDSNVDSQKTRLNSHGR